MRSAAPLVPRRELAKHVQLVLTDRSDLTAGRDFAVASPSTWRLADLSTKYAFLKDCVDGEECPCIWSRKTLLQARWSF